MDSAIVGDKSRLPLHQKRSKDKTFDRIWKYYYLTDKRIELSEKAEAIRQRWEMAWLMDCTLLTKHKMAKRLMKKYGISERQGFKDIVHARLLFSDPTQNNKDAKRAIMSTLLETMIRKAVARSDFKAVDKLILRYDKINGLSVEKDDGMAEYMKKQKPAVIIFNADPETLKLQAEELMKDVEDVEYKEVDEGKS